MGKKSDNYGCGFSIIGLAVLGVVMLATSIADDWKTRCSELQDEIYLQRDTIFQLRLQVLELENENEILMIKCVNE